MDFDVCEIIELISIYHPINCDMIQLFLFQVFLTNLLTFAEIEIQTDVECVK